MNKIISSLLVSLLLVAVTFGQSYPNLPTEFSADVTIQVESSQMPPMPETSGTLYYSYSNLVQRIDVSMMFQTVTTLDRFDQMNEYSYAAGSSDCNCSPLTGKMPLYTVLPGSTYQGQQNVNNVDSDLWSFSMVPGVNITLYVDSSRQVLNQAVMVVNENNIDMTTTMVFSNVNTDVDSSVFNVPSVCQGSCPTPPPVPTPSPTACPNNPPQGCGCASSLNFCSQVTYPIQGASSANDVDSMVEQTFNNFVSLAQPSQACQENMKSFLCATLFPLCTGSVIPVLPCPSLCPSCSCGAGNNTCAGALPNTVCTQYGNGFC